MFWVFKLWNHTSLRNEPLGQLAAVKNTYCSWKLLKDHMTIQENLDLCNSYNHRFNFTSLRSRETGQFHRCSTGSFWANWFTPFLLAYSVESISQKLCAQCHKFELRLEIVDEIELSSKKIVYVKSVRL